MTAQDRTTGESHGRPESPADLTKRSWLYVLRKTLQEFAKDQCTDMAAALTYYAVLALFPALIAVFAVIGLVGDSEQTAQTMLEIVTSLGGSSVADTLEPVVTSITDAPSAGLALIISIALALWSATGYTNAFGRAMNRMYEVGEGRPVWKLRPMMVLVTAVLVCLVALVALGLALSGSVADAVGESLGLGGTVTTVWGFAKWPVILLIVAFMVALLYWATPNVKLPKFKWMSVGAALAIVVWIVASVGFGFYVSNFSSYDRTYGALAGVIVFLLWLWITNLALLLGAELDAELERGRELQSGIAAEETIQLPARDTTKIDKDAKKRDENIAKGRAIREANARIEGGQHSDQANDGEKR